MHVGGFIGIFQGLETSEVWKFADLWADNTLNTVPLGKKVNFA